MSAIFNQSFPSSFLHCCFRRGQSCTYSSKSEGGRPISGKHKILGQLQIESSLREVRYWNTKDGRTLRFKRSQKVRLDKELRLWKPFDERCFICGTGNPWIVKLVKEDGSIVPKFSSGIFELAPMMVSSLRKESLYKSQLNISSQALWSLIQRDVKLAGKLTSGSYWILEQYPISISLREFRSSMQFGRAWTFSQLMMQSSVRLEVGKPSSGKETKFGQPIILISFKFTRKCKPSGRYMRFSQFQIWIDSK